jgi:hypothetical protein
MNELLDLAVKAHGGLERWNKVKAIKVAASITGAIWYVKGKPDFLKNVVLTAETRNERLAIDFPGQNKRAVFEPNRIVIEREDGTLIDARDDPEKSFEGQHRETPWDDIHVAYFVGEALWTYLNTPFLYTHEGFVTEEVPSIQVESETWRRLKVTFPDSVKSHTKEQITHIPSVSLLPNLIHGRQCRSIDLERDRLVLRAVGVPAAGGLEVTSRLDWKRMTVLADPARVLVPIKRTFRE